jgi:AraC-like DNA-binding protein
MSAIGIARIAKRRCPRCGVTYASTRQNFVTRVSTRTGKRSFRHCKACSRKEQAALRADPVFYARKLDYERGIRMNLTDAERELRNRKQQERRDRKRARDRRRNRAYRQKKKVTAPLVGPFGERLPAEQFTDWLCEKFAGWSTSDMAVRLGMDPSSAARLRSGKQETVSLPLVDRALTNADCSYLLAIWYPLDEAPTQ